MAILDGCPGIEATICSEDSSLPEYDDPEADAGIDAKYNTVTKYVESTPRSAFTIRFAVSPPFKVPRHGIIFNVYVHGKLAGGKICFRDDLDRKHRWSMAFTGIDCKDEDGFFIKKLRFAELELTDDNKVLSKKAKTALAQTGTIEVKVYELCNPKKGRPTIVRPEFRKKIPEKAVKGKSVSLSVTYAEDSEEERVKSPQHWFVIDPLNGWDKPLASFTFKYRSRTDLEREMIIPHPLTPKLEDSDNDEEVWEYQLVRVKRKAKAGVKREHIEIKQEGEERRVKHRYLERDLGNGRILIDLESRVEPSALALDRTITARHNVTRAHVANTSHSAILDHYHQHKKPLSNIGAQTVSTDMSSGREMLSSTASVSDQESEFLNPLTNNGDSLYQWLRGFARRPPSGMKRRRGRF